MIKRWLRPYTSQFKNRVLGSVIGYDVAPQKLVALTFDDGPNPDFTAPILDVLDEYGVKATFFLLGRNVDLFPEAAAKIVQRGHVVGSHTYNHTRLLGLSRAAVAREIREGQESIHRATGVRPGLFRPPHGRLDRTSFLTARWMGFRPVLWTMSGQDWLSGTAEEIVDRLLGAASPGNIFLLHDAYRDVTDAQAGDRSRTVEAVRLLIEKLTAQDYQFLTLSQMSKFPERRVYFKRVPPP